MEEGTHNFARGTTMNAGTRRIERHYAKQD